MRDYYRSVSLRTIPSVQSRVSVLAAMSEMSLSVVIDGTQTAMQFLQLQIAAWWYSNGGVDEQVYDVLTDQLFPKVSNGDIAALQFTRDEAGEYRVAIIMTVPFSVVQTASNDSDIAYLLGFGTTEHFINPTVPLIEYELITNATTAEIDSVDHSIGAVRANIFYEQSPPIVLGVEVDHDDPRSITDQLISNATNKHRLTAERYTEQTTQSEHLRLRHPTSNIACFIEPPLHPSYVYTDLLDFGFDPARKQDYNGKDMVFGMLIANHYPIVTVDPDPTPDEPEEPTMTTPTYGAGLLSAVVTAAALRAQLDEQVGWHKSLSNVVVNGPTGMSQAITWDLEDPDTDAGYLNSHDVTTMIQHQGFRFWGNRNCSSDPRFAFEVATRTAQTVLETIVQGCFPFIDQPLTPILARDIIDSINAKLRELKNANRLIGASCWYDPEGENSTQALSQGQLWIDYDYTPVPTLENLGLNQRITDRYLVDLSKLISGSSTEAA